MKLFFLKKQAPTSLRRAVIVRFSLFIIVTAAIFTAFSFVALYSLEDAFIVRNIENEARHLHNIQQESGAWEQPRFSNMRLIHGMKSLPEEILELLREEPRRIEFFGADDQHYHLHRMRDTKETYLLAEVSAQLEVRPMRKVYLIVYGGLAAFMTLLAVIVAWRLSNNLIAPLGHLAELVHHSTPQDLPSGFAQDYPNNEIGQLATTLEKSMQRICEFVDREQHFTRDASHELRTPIAIVKNAAELLIRNPSLPPNAKAQVERIAQASAQMEQAVNTLLSLARETSDQLQEQVKLLPLVEQCVVSHHHLLADKSVEVEVSIPESASVFVNPGALNILLANLISNAFQYTVEGSVQISWEGQRLVVTDTGPGIEKGLQGAVFKPLVKGPNSMGFGIGLSIVKRLCERHHFELKMQQLEAGIAVSVGFRD